MILPAAPRTAAIPCRQCFQAAAILGVLLVAAHLAAARTEEMEQHSLVGDPRFRDPDAGDFRFKSGSAAPKFRIQPIDLRNVGLR